MHRTNSCNYGDKREGKTQGNRQAFLSFTEARAVTAANIPAISWTCIHIKENKAGVWWILHFMILLPFITIILYFTSYDLAFLTIIL